MTIYIDPQDGSTIFRTTSQAAFYELAKVGKTMEQLAETNVDHPIVLADNSLIWVEKH